MTKEDHVREAIIAELQRQSEISERGLKVSTDDGRLIRIEGQVDLDELAMAIMGTLAGGP